MKYLKKLNIKLVRGEYQNPVKGQVREPGHIYRTFQAIKDSAQELLIGVYLNDDLEVLSYDTLSVGGESVALVIPREIFGRAFVMRAKHFILIHNHPSGDPTPSAADHDVIKALKDQSAIMKIAFLDFIVVGERRYWSMFEEADGGEYALGNIH
jgi:DNA repair protein RadC